MSMDQKTIQKVARLARIEMSDAEQSKVAPKLSGILDWMEMLNELDTGDVAPLENVVNIALELREDIVNDGGIRDKVLANAPDETQGFFVVPKVIE